jgi:hypothetical protein
MNIESFAGDHHLRLKRPPKEYEPGPHPDSPYIPGRRGWITENAGSMKLFVQTKRVGDTLRHGEKLGMQPQGRGDYELMLRFDPADPEQVNFAIQAVKAYRKRSVGVTPEMLAHLEAARAVRRMPFPARNFYQEGRLGTACVVTLGTCGQSSAVIGACE